MLHYVLYKVVTLLYFLLVCRFSHPSSCKRFVTDPGSMESSFLQNVLSVSELFLVFFKNIILTVRISCCRCIILISDRPTMIS